MIKSSLELLPVELQKLELYQIIANLIDETMRVCDIDLNDEKIASELIHSIMPDFKDISAVNIFYNMFIRPILGTKTAVQSGFKLVRDPGEVREWWEAGISPYHFSIEYKDTIPENLSIKDIIELSDQLKNERSHLISIRNPDCPGSLNWDYTKWDWTFWDTVAGIIIDDVYVCLRRVDRDLVKHFLKVYATMSIHYQQLINFIGGGNKWDEFWWDWFGNHGPWGYSAWVYFDYKFLDINIDKHYEQEIWCWIDDILEATMYLPIPYVEEIHNQQQLISMPKQWAGSWDTNKNWITGGSPYGAFSTVKYEILGLREFGEDTMFEFTRDNNEFNVVISENTPSNLGVTATVRTGSTILTDIDITLEN